MQKKQALLDDFCRRELKEAIRPVIAKWEKQLEINVDRFFVQRMKTKWGSSNPRLRTIRLNLDLIKRPIECLDYVILHEMLHFLVPNHSALFIAKMDTWMPNWRLIRQTLNDAPLSSSIWINQ